MRKYSYPELVEFYNSLAVEHSPPRPRSKTPKRSPQPSPTRRALQQCSASQENVVSAPTIRIVADSGPEVYSKSPFPTLPSQILPPAYPQGGVSADQDEAVSDENTSANAYAKKPSDDTLVPKPLQPRRLVRASTSTTTSDADTLTASSLIAPSSSRLTQSTSPPSTPPDVSDLLETTLPSLPEESTAEADVSRSTIRKVVPSSPIEEPPLATKRSEASIATSNSSNPFTSSDRLASSPNYYVFEPANPPEESSSGPTLKRKRDFSNLKKPAPKPYESLESIAFSDASYSSLPDRPRSASGPASTPNAAIRAAVETGVKIQYPVVRPPSNSGSWAESSISRPPPPPPESLSPSSMNESVVRPPQWTSRLSTIPSESERPSQSLDGSGRRSDSQSQKRRRTFGSMMSSEGSAVWTGTSEGSIRLPPPLFHRNGNYAKPLPDIQGRDSEERYDTVGELQSPPLRRQRSGFLSRIKNRPPSSDSVQSQVSQISFLGELSWAKDYYRYGEAGLPRSPYYRTSASESRPNTATETEGYTESPTSDRFPANIYRPRNRPFYGSGRRRTRPESTTDSMPIEEGTPRNSRIRSRIIGTVESLPGSLREIWSPHLFRDRRSSVHYGAWAAPSFEEPFWSKFYGPVNRQIWLFCIGFVLPLGELTFTILNTVVIFVF